MSTLYYSSSPIPIACIDHQEESKIPVSLNRSQAKRIGNFVGREIEKHIKADTLLLDFDGWSAFIVRDQFPIWMETKLDSLAAKLERRLQK